MGKDKDEIIEKKKIEEESTKPEKIYEVTTKGHTCLFRSGKTFGKVPTYLKESELTDELKKDPMLIIEEKK